MPDSDGVSDPTDFSSTPLAALGHIDALLRCQICKDFFSSAVLTSCCHTFCSLCIRRSLAAEGKCPTCRTTELESKLRKNVVVQELVDAFTRTRSQLLTVANTYNTNPTDHENNAANSSILKRKRVNNDDRDVQPPPAQLPRTRSQYRHAHDHTSDEPANTNSSDSPPQSSLLPSQDRSDERANLVPCPICNVSMKPEAVFNHLDTCKGPDIHTKSTRPPTPSVATTAIQPTTDRLPQLNYSLFKENALRKKLSELSIPSWGPKGLLLKRHTEWINLWNSNCDSNHPKSRKQLLAELDSWERSQGGRAKSHDLHTSNASTEGTTGNTNGILRKDFDRSTYAKQNKTSFDALIAMARKGPVSGSSGATEIARPLVPTDPLPSALPSPTSARSNSLNGSNSGFNEDIFSSSPTSASGHFAKAINYANGRDRRLSSPVPGFSPSISRENSRSAQTQNSSSNISASGRRVIRRGSLGFTAPTSPPTESSLPDRIFRKSSIGDGDHIEAGTPEIGESSLKKRPMFEVPREPVTDADLNDSSR